MPGASPSSRCREGNASGAVQEASGRQYRRNMPWIAEHPDGSTLTVWAVPGASRTEIRGLHDEALRIRLAAPAEGGKANRELLKLLKTKTGARQVTLLSGAASRKKTVLLRNIHPEQGRKLLARGEA